MESRGARGDHGRHHLDHQQLLLRPAPAWSFSGGGGVPWPAAAQRSSSSYTCGYCKREFRSAQALGGGHMNVHRRERARLRYYYSHRLPNLNFSPPLYCCTGDTTTATPPAVYSFFSTAAPAAEAGTKAAALELNLELEVGGGFGDEGLDLELRLGCS